VHRHDRSDPLALQGIGDPLHVEVEGVGANIDEQWVRPHIADHLRGRRERVGRRQHLVAAFTPTASSARCIAAVHEFTAIACFAPTSFANAASNERVFAPVVSQPERITSATARPLLVRVGEGERKEALSHRSQLRIALSVVDSVSPS